MANNPELDKDLIRELAELLDETALTEIEWTQGDRTVRVARQSGTAVASAAALPPAASTAPVEAAAEPATVDHASHPGAILSPMVGTTYVAPEPGATPFVQVGAQVSEGQTVLIIEAMKTMNPIPAPKSGTIRQILVSDGVPVEYGEVLMIVE
ncbi:MAG: acetyl-CoA carboxylase, biotin carboxyl carrier protein [Alphaproteobacteria bacterium]|nr:acetyl-CoA carboxylase, biotin carboxyl carrier protein [Alphaproteobacteria bacterium]|tara:strand:+ start:1391 stop:1849 length:459 start_codon:yes stop_codon:yes gene_type:complete